MNNQLFQTGIACILLLFCDALSAETTTDSALWMGGLALFENDRGLDYSMEYQIRLDDHMSSLNNHFVEFMGYNKAAPALLLNGGYRFTKRPDRVENRFYLGGFWNITKSLKPQDVGPGSFRVVFQFGYQHDFNVKFDDQLMQSNSIRWILVVSKPVTEKVRPFLLAGVLTTWNEAYNFGVDKVRVGGGLAYQFSKQSRLRAQYIFEDFRFVTPRKHTNIIWLRYEMTLGRQAQDM
jgi:hypothetical protein